MSAPRLSVLDLAPVSAGMSTAEALRQSLELARAAERLGYHRYWVAEHHNMPAIASSSPAVLVAHIAGVTSRMRVGSGGVMLPNHPILIVAEEFGMLEALHPGRIDLGIGRAPGTDLVTASLLRRAEAPPSPESFCRQIGELIAFFDGSFPPNHPYARMTAMPARGNAPAFWVLGSSEFSAEVAAVLGLPFAFAHHLGAARTLPSVELYRSRFEPSPHLDRPCVMISVGALCADDDESARRLAAPHTVSLLLLRHGRPSELPTPEEAAAYVLTEDDTEYARTLAAGQIVGSPDRFRAELDALIAATAADEVMLTTATHDPRDRLHSYSLIAELYDAPSRG